MDPNWVTINTKSGLIVQLNPDTIDVKENGELSVDTMVYTQDGNLVNDGKYDREVETTISEFIHKVLQEHIEDKENE